VRLALDHHYTTEIANQLRRRRHDVVAAVENAWERLDDDALLKTCADERRALLTNNVADFAPLARSWMAEGRTHFGLIFTSDVSLPRHRATTGLYVARLGGLLRSNPADNALANRVEWL
jgi:Domain of unknown function (DUF5615)